MGFLGRRMGMHLSEAEAVQKEFEVLPDAWRSQSFGLATSITLISAVFSDGVDEVTGEEIGWFQAYQWPIYCGIGYLATGFIANNKLTKTVELHNLIGDASHPAYIDIQPVALNPAAIGPGVHASASDHEPPSLSLRLALCRYHRLRLDVGAASFDDGTEIEYEVVSDNSEDIKSLWMSWGGMTGSSTCTASVSTTGCRAKPSSTSASILGTALLSPDEDSLYVDGTKPRLAARGDCAANVCSTVKTKENKISLKSVANGANERTVYVTNYDLPRTTYYCLHGGVGYQNRPEVRGGVSYGEIALGVSLMRARNTDLQLFTSGKSGAKQQRGSSFMEVYADVLLFTNAGPYTLDAAMEMADEGVEARPVEHRGRLARHDHPAERRCRIRSVRQAGRRRRSLLRLRGGWIWLHVRPRGMTLRVPGFCFSCSSGYSPWVERGAPS